MTIKLSYRRRFFSVVVALALTSLVSLTPTTSVTPVSEWKVQVGDRMTYHMVKYFDISDNDGDGDTNSRTFEIIDEYGDEVEITCTTDFFYEYEITQLNGEAKVKITYDGKITEEESSGWWIIMKTIDNQSYWEEIIDKTIMEDGYDHYLEGEDYVVQTQFEDLPGETLEQISKRNWRTGWLTYKYSHSYNDTHTLQESEITTNPPTSVVPGFELPSLILGIIVLTLVIARRRVFN